MSLPELKQAVSDLEKHTARRDDARTKRRAMAMEIEQLKADESDAVSAIEVTQKLVAELATAVLKAGGK